MKLEVSSGRKAFLQQSQQLRKPGYKFYPSIFKMYIVINHEKGDSSVRFLPGAKCSMLNAIKKLKFDSAEKESYVLSLQSWVLKWALCFGSGGLPRRTAFP